jgi:N-acetyl-gamma-glutamyl-phosphate reductase
MKSIAILGASGYTGAELIRLLVNHPHASITALTGESQAGKPLGAVYPHLAFAGLPDLVTVEQVDFSAVDAVFCCLPHGTTQGVIAALPERVKVVDLSADFRLHDVEQYARWYGHAHQAPELQKTAVYGLCEQAREEIRSARLVANPGCYPTSAQLPLIPLLKERRIEAEGIIIDAKSGISGAGRSAKQNLLYGETAENFSAYGIGNHRHLPEIEQGLSAAAGHSVTVTFTPHLVPMSRGILSTLYVKLAAGQTVESLRQCLLQAYAGEPFVQVLASAGEFPATAQVRGTNLCRIGVYADHAPGRAIIVSVIDNLGKGAAGQALQNLNLMFGWEETLALPRISVYP